MDKEKQPGYYMMIPAIVWDDQTLSQSAKILYGHISTLTQKNGYCWASNAYFAKVMNLSERSVQLVLDDLEKRNHIKRTLTTDEDKNTSRTIKNLRTPTSPVPDEESCIPPDVESFTHNKTSTNKQDNILINKPRKRSTKKIDPQHQEASVTFELESLARWNELTRLWFTGENPHGLKGTYRKYFVDLGTEGQEALLKMIKSFGSDVHYLFNVWIGKTFKENCMNEQFLKDAIVNAKEIEKRKTPSKAGQYKKPSFFGNE